MYSNTSKDLVRSSLPGPSPNPNPNPNISEFSVYSKYLRLFMDFVSGLDVSYTMLSVDAPVLYQNKVKIQNENMMKKKSTILNFGSFFNEYILRLNLVRKC